MTYDELKSEIYEAMKNKPKDWRKGQFVFNYTYKKYPSAVDVVQFEDRVDCFYRDEVIDRFIEFCVKRINELYYFENT